MTNVYLKNREVYVELDNKDMDILLGNSKSKYVSGNIFSQENKFIARYSFGYNERESGFIGGLLNIEPNSSFEKTGMLFIDFSGKSLKTLESKGGFKISFENRLFNILYRDFSSR